MEPAIFEMVRAGIAEHGLRPYARKLNIPVGVLRSIQAERDTPYSSLKALSHALGLEFYIGPKRDAGPIEIAEIDGEEFAPVRRFSAELSAGNGAENGEAHVSEMLAFRRDWLTRLGVSPSNACLVKVRGESMQPTLHDGDLVLIDQSKTAIRSGRIYAFNDGGHSKVKRLDCMDDHTLIIRSDNPQFPLDIRKGEDANALKVIGEVVWSGHTFG